MRSVAYLLCLGALTSCVGSVDAGMPLEATYVDGDPSPRSDDGPSDPDTVSGDPPSSDGDTASGDGVVPDDGVPAQCNALFCEDFESFTIGGAPTSPWSASVNQGVVAVDDEHANSGTHAVKFTTNGGSGTYRRAFIGMKAPYFPINGNHFFGRMMVWLTEAPTTTVHWTNIQAEGDVEGDTYRSIYRYGGQVDKKIMANYETSGKSTDCWQHSNQVMPEQHWACIEWEFDGTADTMRYWLDGTALTAITVVGEGSGCIAHDLDDKWIAPVFDTLYLGWEHYQAVSAREMWIDDVAIDTMRVGCPP